MSQKTIEMYGFTSAEEMLGLEFKEFVAPEEAGTYKSQWQLMVRRDYDTYDGFGIKPYVEIVVESSE